MDKKQLRRNNYKPPIMFRINEKEKWEFRNVVCYVDEK